MPASEPAIVYIVGPTAAGKTRLGIELAQRLNGEIINADSRQVYRHMDIGTAKPTAEEQLLASHHLLDLLSPDKNFSLGVFLSLAKKTVAEIQGRCKLPIVVGGTGQYVWALLEGWDVPEVPPDEEFRKKLESEAAEMGHEELHRLLQSIDPERASELDPRNIRRVIRALEIHHLTGNRPSSFGKATGLGLPGPILGLTMEREDLYQRIDRRVDLMMHRGFLQEATLLTEMGFCLGEGSLACPGYRELGLHLSGDITLEDAIQRTKFQTHRLARRQYSWFKLSDPRISWLNGASDDLFSAAELQTYRWSSYK